MTNIFKVQIPSIGIKETYISSRSQLRARTIMKHKYNLKAGQKLILSPVS